MTSNNPFDDEDLVLKALSELLYGSYERTAQSLRSEAAIRQPEEEKRPDSGIATVYLGGSESAAEFKGCFEENSVNEIYSASASAVENKNCNDDSSLISKGVFFTPVSPDEYRGQIGDRLWSSTYKGSPAIVSTTLPLATEVAESSSNLTVGSSTLTSNRQDSGILNKSSDSFSYSFLVTDDGSHNEMLQHFRDITPSAPTPADIAKANRKTTLADLEMLYQCPICLELPRGVVQETECCSQFFCEACIRESLNATHDRTCPLCRFDGPIIRRNTLVEDRLAFEEISCRTCDFVGIVADMLEHERLCDKFIHSASKPNSSSTAQMAIGRAPAQHTVDAEDVNSMICDQWACERCTLLNDISLEVCDVCNYPSPRPLRQTPPIPPTNTLPQSTPPFPCSPVTPTVPPGSSLANSVASPPCVPRVDSSSKITAESSSFLVSQVKCPFCSVILHVPSSLRSPGDPFRCGSCWNQILLPTIKNGGKQSGSLKLESPLTSKNLSSGFVLLKVAFGSIMRKEKWRLVTWRVDDHGLSFLDKAHLVIRRVHIHPFAAFTQITQSVKRPAGKPAVTYFVTKMVENPRSAVAKSFQSVRKGSFTPELPVSEICEVASEGSASNVIRFVEAVEAAVGGKRSTMANLQQS